MRSRFARLGSHLDSVVRDRRPRRFRADADELEMIRVATELRAAHPGAATPAPAFVDGLARRLRHRAELEERADRGRPRRRFLQATGVAAAAAVAGVVGDRLVENLTSGEDAHPYPRELVPRDGRWVGVSEASAVTAGRLVRFSTRGVEGFLVNREGTISALSAICTHMGCTLAPDDSGRNLLCPCHSTSFGTDGAQTGGRYTVPPLPSIRARVRDGTVEVFVA